MIGLKNGTIHDGCGRTYVADILIEGSTIKQIAPDIQGTDVKWIDCSGKTIFPGFIDCASEWGIMQKGQELRGEVKDNDERVDPFTPEMDIKWAFNGRCITEQEIYTYGITTVGVMPSNSNVFGGFMAAYDSKGLNPMSMLIREKVGAKLCVNHLTKKVYGAKNVSPMTRMGIFSLLQDKLREASEYQPDDQTKRDEKLVCLKKVIDAKIPLFISANSPTEMLNAYEIIKPYGVPTVFVNGYGADEELAPLVGKNAGLVVASVTSAFGMEPRYTDYDAIIALYRKGLKVALTAFGDNVFPGKEELLWTGIRMYKASHNTDEVLAMMTRIPAEFLGIADHYGTIEVGKQANIVIWTADPLATYKGRVAQTLLNGKIIFEAEVA